MAEIRVGDLTDRELVDCLQKILHQQRQLECDLLVSMRELVLRRAYFAWGFRSAAEFFQHTYGMSRDVTYKLSRTARMIGPYPEFLDLLRDGKTHLSQLIMVAPRITQANAELILDFIPDRSARALRDFLSRLTCDGKIYSQ